MILTPKQRKAILKNSPNKALVQAAKEYSTRLLMHIKGIGLDRHIQHIEGFENKDDFKVKNRRKYGKSNKDLFSRLHRPVDKVYTGKGGSAEYNLSETQEKQLLVLLDNVENGFDMRTWMKTFYRHAFHFDPMGLIFIEVDANGEAYPTYKPTSEIFDYQLNGRFLDYIVFHVDKATIAAKGLDDKLKYFRFVDDATDTILSWDGNNMATVKNETFVNFFGQVPAIIISNIYDPVRGMWISPDDDIIELAEEFLIDGTVKNIFKKYFGFPRAWEYSSTCPKCDGHKTIGGDDCEACNGTGVKHHTTPGETIRVTPPTGKDDVKLAPDLAGYVTPDIEGWQKMTDELQLLENLMQKTYWGTHQREDATNETATGRFIDVQPVQERLDAFSEGAETVEEFVVKMIARIALRYFNYEGPSINYGRRFLIETADAVWNKYKDSRKDGASASVLDDLLKEYFATKYSNDAQERQKNLRLMQLEPLVHMTVEQCKELLPGELLAQKIFISQWAATIPLKELCVAPIESLEKKLADYAMKRMSMNQEDKKIPLAVRLGQTATTGLKEVLKDTGINDESKRNILTILFGVSKEEAAKMVITMEPVTAPGEVDPITGNPIPGKDPKEDPKKEEVEKPKPIAA